MAAKKKEILSFRNVFLGSLALLAIIIIYFFHSIGALKLPNLSFVKNEEKLCMDAVLDKVEREYIPFEAKQRALMKKAEIHMVGLASGVAFRHHINQIESATLEKEMAVYMSADMSKCPQQFKDGIEDYVRATNKVLVVHQDVRRAMLKSEETIGEGEAPLLDMFAKGIAMALQNGVNFIDRKEREIEQINTEREKIAVKLAEFYKQY